MGRKLAGAALHRHVEKQLREELRDELMHWGINIDEYTVKVENIGSVNSNYAFDPDLILFATLTRAVSGATIDINEIFTSDSGEITQRSGPQLS